MTPIRTCIACRSRAPQDELVRFVRQGDDVVEATSPRLSGRGGYLHEECFDLAEKRQAIRRFFGPGARLAARRPVPGGSAGPGGL